MTSTREQFDTIVIGAGLSGLVAAIGLAKAGKDVLLLERRAVPGGLCGTKEIDGYEFVVGCNDFGGGMVKILSGLGVPTRFRAVETRFFFKDAVIHAPFGWKTLRHLLPRAADVVRLALALRRSGPDSEPYVGPLVARCVRDQTLADLVNSMGYAQGVLPDDLRVAALQADFSQAHGYEYDRPVIPEGGPATLARDLARTFERYGGKLLVETECRGTERDGAGHRVATSRGHFRAAHVISSQGRWDRYPSELKRGLRIGAFLLAVKKDFPFPRGVHTLIHLPPGVASWMRQLEGGELPAALGFHIFRSALPERADHYTMNLFFYPPASEGELSPAAVQRMETYIFTELERLLPGVSQALLYKRFVSPQAFVELHGLSSRPSELVAKAGFEKPESYDPSTGIHHVGNSVLPAGEHAGGAVLSGHRAAARVLSLLDQAQDPRPA